MWFIIFFWEIIIIQDKHLSHFLFDFKEIKISSEELVTHPHDKLCFRRFNIFN